ncbi:MAG: helix-turn-helix domain-containing protein [Thiogranum sp.]
MEDLTHTDKPVAAIGESLGFGSPASFTRAFKTWTGQSPREYRKVNESHIS